MNDNIRCTAPGCKKCLPAVAMWLPERKALAAANGGVRVQMADFSKFALCGRCGHRLRQSGVRVYRYTEEVARETAEAARRASADAAWKPFADRFVSKTNANGKGSPEPRRPRVDYSATGMGLSRCAKIDASKRPSPVQPEEPKPKGAVVARP